MREIQAHDYPGLGIFLQRDVPREAPADAGTLIRAAFEIFEEFLRVYEVELEISHDKGLEKYGLRVPLPPGIDERIGPWPTEVVNVDRLKPFEIASWVEPLTHELGGMLDWLEVRTGTLAACAPECAADHSGIDLLAGGETYHLRFLNVDGTHWTVGPIKHIGASAPIEVALVGQGRRWRLEINLLWSVWEIGDRLDGRLQSCLDALEQAGWLRSSP